MDMAGSDEWSPGRLVREFAYRVTSGSVEGGVVSWSDLGFLLEDSAEVAEISEVEREVGLFGDAVVPSDEELRDLALACWESAHCTEVRVAAEAGGPTPLFLTVLGISPVFELTFSEAAEVARFGEFHGRAAFLLEGLD